MHGGIRTAVVLALVAVGLMVAAPPAQAIIFDLTSDHCDPLCGPQSPNFGNVELIQNGTTVDVTVTLLNNNKFVKTGAGDMEWFKFNATGVVVGDISVNQSFPTHTLAAQTGAFNGDGTGSFAFGITCTDCGTGGSAANQGPSPLVFHVANALISDLTTANANGNVFVADILSGTNGNTGVVDATTPRTSVVPEPATVAFLGTGLVALGFAIRRRRVQR